MEAGAELAAVRRGACAFRLLWLRALVWLGEACARAALLSVAAS